MRFEDGNTTASIQRYIDQLGGDPPASEAIRILLERSTSRLYLLCNNLLRRRYPRLTQPPMNLRTEELLSSVVERMIKALRDVKPNTVRQFFSIAGQHMRWELNDLARRLDKEMIPSNIDHEILVSFDASDSQLSDLCKQIFKEIDSLPVDQREVFELARIQGLPVSEIALMLNVSEVTIRRRLNRAIGGLSSLFESEIRQPNSD